MEDELGVVGDEGTGTTESSARARDQLTAAACCDEADVDDTNEGCDRCGDTSDANRNR